MHVVIWEASRGSVAYGPFPDAATAEEWLFPLMPFVVPEIDATVAVVTPAYDFRSDDAPPGKAADRRARHTGTGSDRWAYGYLVSLMTGKVMRGLVGVFSARRDASAWWDSQARAVEAAYGSEVRARVVPLLPVPCTLDGLADLFASIKADGGCGADVIHLVSQESV